MRWITFLLLLYVMAAMQCARFGAFPASNDTFFPQLLYIQMLAVFYALFASDFLAPLAALVCGATFDLLNGEFLGTTAVPLALMAWLLVRVRPSLFREHMFLQMITTLLALLAWALLDAIFRRLLHAPLVGLYITSDFFHLAGDTVYTAIVAPLLFWLFFRFQPLLGFTPHGPRGRGHG